ncbi:hypothetical protein ACIP69_16600 [Streptomyces hygroscopicus]|uniref:hypothetical protein n=1 Tax=Streptomyces hygroscopicus TaxID=1912 RepID=UPI000767CD80
MSLAVADIDGITITRLSERPAPIDRVYDIDETWPAFIPHELVGNALLNQVPEDFPEIDVLLGVQLRTLHGHLDQQGSAVLRRTGRGDRQDLGQPRHPGGDIPRGGAGRRRVQGARPGRDQHLFGGAALQMSFGGHGLGTAGLADPVVLGGRAVGADRAPDAQAQHHEHQPSDDRAPGVQSAPPSGAHR